MLNALPTSMPTAAQAGIPLGFGLAPAEPRRHPPGAIHPGPILAALPQPLMVALPDRRLLFSNASAEALLGRHLAEVRADRLMQLGQLDAARLQDLLRSAAAGSSVHLGLWFKPQLSTGWLHASRLSPELALQADWPLSALLLSIHLDQPTLTQSARIDALTDRHRLSPTERHVLMLLADGMTVEETAQHLGLRTSTLRSHVRNLLGKTGAGALMQLLRWVGSGR